MGDARVMAIEMEKAIDNADTLGTKLSARDLRVLEPSAAEIGGSGHGTSIVS